MNIYDVLTTLVEKVNWTSEQDKRENLAVIESIRQNNVFGTVALRMDVQAHACIAKSRFRGSRTQSITMQDAIEFRRNYGPDICQICGREMIG